MEAEWRSLNFTAPPDLSRACDEYDKFLDMIVAPGVDLQFLDDDSSVGLDSIYCRDASVHGPGDSVVLCCMGKDQRRGEPAVQRRAFERAGLRVAGEIRAPGRLEGGDVVWLDDRHVAVGRGYRTNDAGIDQYRALLGDSIDELITVPLPHWKGTGDVFHLMSIISPVDRDLAVVYSPLMSVPFRERLLEMGYGLVEVPDGEFDSMGANVLAVAPRCCVMLDGNPATRRALEAHGADVRVYNGAEISLKGGGGPTCLTRPTKRGRFSPEQT